MASGLAGGAGGAYPTVCVGNAPGLIGQQLAQIQPGAFPTQTVGYAPPAAPASPLSTALGVGTGIASIGSKLGLFG